MGEETQACELNWQSTPIWRRDEKSRERTRLPRQEYLEIYIGPCFQQGPNPGKFLSSLKHHATCAIKWSCFLFEPLSDQNMWILLSNQVTWHLEEYFECRLNRNKMPHVKLNWQITRCLAFRRTQITCIDGKLFTSFWECLLIWNDFPQAYRRLHVFYKVVSDLFHK